METDRLIIRYIKYEDYDDICEYGCDEETGKYMLHWPKTRAQIREFIELCISYLKSDKPVWHEFVMQLKGTAKVIGNITLQITDEEAEIGWISNKDYWNQGYMTEAVKAVIGYAFEELDIKKIIATCTEKNVASYKVMEKCGMEKVMTYYNYKAVKQGVEITYNKLTYVIER